MPEHAPVPVGVELRRDVFDRRARIDAARQAARRRGGAASAIVATVARSRATSALSDTLGAELISICPPGSNVMRPPSGSSISGTFAFADRRSRQSVRGASPPQNRQRRLPSLPSSGSGRPVRRVDRNDLHLGADARLRIGGCGRREHALAEVVRERIAVERDGAADARPRRASTRPVKPRRSRHALRPRILAQRGDDERVRRRRIA